MRTFYLLIALVASATTGMMISVDAPISAFLASFVAYAYGAAILKGRLK